MCQIYWIAFSFIYICCKWDAIIFVLGGPTRIFVLQNIRSYKRIRTRCVIRRVRQVQDVVDLAVREAHLVLPALQQVLRRVGERHAPGEGAETGFVPHRPAFKGGHARDRIVDANERRAAEPGVQLLKRRLQFGEEMGAARVFAFEGQPQTFDWCAACGFRRLLTGCPEHPVPPGRVAGRSPGWAGGPATRHPVSVRSRGGPQAALPHR